MKKQVKNIYNFIVMGFFILLSFLIVNFAFAYEVGDIFWTQTFDFDGNEVVIGVYDNTVAYAVTVVSIQTGDCSDVILQYVVSNEVFETSPQACGTNFNFEIDYSQNISDVYNQATIFLFDTNGVGYPLNNFFFETTDNEVVSLFGTSSSVIISDVIGGVQSTGGVIGQFLPFAGVPVGFGVLGYLVWFIRRSA